MSSGVFGCVGVAFGELDFPGVEVAVGVGADLSGEGSTKGAGLGSLAWRERGSWVEVARTRRAASRRIFLGKFSIVRNKVNTSSIFDWG